MIITSPIVTPVVTRAAMETTISAQWPSTQLAARRQQSWGQMGSRWLIGRPVSPRHAAGGSPGRLDQQQHPPLLCSAHRPALTALAGSLTLLRCGGWCCSCLSSHPCWCGSACPSSVARANVRTTTRCGAAIELGWLTACRRRWQSRKQPRKREAHSRQPKPSCDTSGRADGSTSQA